MPEKFLPIGSVVLLKGGSKRLMITGFCVMAKDNSNVMYDYCGCLYPEGVISSDQTALFNHEQIEKIFYIGLSDEEEKTFKEKLKTILNENNTTSTANGTSGATETTDGTDDISKIPPIGPGL